jgi:alanyl-tRNA synthetase
MLYDSYGFPLELTKEIATEKWINVDEVLFQAALEEAREKSRQWTKEMFKKWTDRSMHLEWIQATKFIWYEQLQSEDIKLIKDFVVDWKRILIFDKTPFYAESGGQTGDRGSIILDSGETVKIQDVKKYEWVFLHFLG